MPSDIANNRFHPHFWVFLLLITVSVWVAACSNTDEPNQPDPEEEETTYEEVNIDPESTHQIIAGFGGANRMWGTQFLEPAEAKLAFGTDDTDLGLSLFRVRIPSNPNEWPLILESVQEAQSYGVKIMASPWSPPAALKSNNSDVGGYLPEENYEAFANHINDYLAYMADNGVEIYTISIQNEPDIEVSYESCDWTATAMRDFIANYGPMIEGTLISAPESFNFSQSFTNSLLSDEAASANFDIVAGHIYGGGLGPFPLAEEQGKEIWMTEYLMNLGATDEWENIAEDVKWDETMVMLNTIHEAMEYNWNAYIWWYLQRYYSFIGDGIQGTTSGEVLKRGYAFSHYSMFVRPGYSRVEVEVGSESDLDITAYQGDGKVVAVIINQSANPAINVRLGITGKTVSSATSYTTALNVNRAEKELDLQEGVVVSVSPRAVMTVVMEVGS